MGIVWTECRCILQSTKCLTIYSDLRPAIDNNVSARVVVTGHVFSTPRCEVTSAMGFYRNLHEGYRKGSS